MNYYSEKSNEESNSPENEGAYHPMYGPRVDVNNGRVNLVGTVVLYGANNNTEIARDHFSKAIQEWNRPAFNRNVEDPLQQLGRVQLNGQMVPVHFDIDVVIKTPAEVRRELTNPKENVVYILVGNDTISDYASPGTRDVESMAPIINRSLQPNAQDNVYAQQLITNNGLAGALNPTALRPTSFIIGNLGFYDLPISQARNHTTAAHELGHWFTHHFQIGQTFDSHYPFALNTPNNWNPTFWGDSRHIMSFGRFPGKRKVHQNEVARIGYGQDMNIYAQNSARPQAHYLGDRNRAGNLVLYNAADMFVTPVQAMIFEQLLGSPNSWNPLTDPAPQ